MTIVKLPDPTQLDIDARATLGNPRASKTDVDAAINRLQCSQEWQDIRLISDARNAMWAARLQQKPDDNRPPAVLVAFVLVGAALTLGAVIGLGLQAWWLM